MKRHLTAIIAALALGAALASGGPAQSDAQARSERLRIPEIAAMPAGSWRRYGRPWRDIDPGDVDNCGHRLGAILGAWNGVLWDGRYAWNWAGGGHNDGCFNGVVRYDLQAGRAEVVVPHLPLNVPFCRGPFTKTDGEADCYLEPYAGSITYPTGPDGRVVAESEPEGDFLRPRSSHMYNNMVRIGDFVYLLTGQIYQSGRWDQQVWRFNVEAPGSTIERLPDRPSSADRPGNWLLREGRPPLFVTEHSYCEPDLVAGDFNCTKGPYIGLGTAAWDESRGGFWALDAGRARLLFVKETPGGWVAEKEISDPLLDKDMIGNGGICLVPTEAGGVPVIWGATRGGEARLLRWNGKAIAEITGQAGQPVTAASSILNKWTWNDDLGVCLGTWAWDEGIWTWRPDFANATPAALHPAPAAVPTPTATPAPAPAPAQVGLPPAPKVKTTLESNPLAGAETTKARAPAPKRKTDKPAGASENAAAALKDRATAAPEPESTPDPGPDPEASLPPVEFFRFGDHLAAPEPVALAAWDQPAVLSPEAPDVEALCPGEWVERTYSTSEEVGTAEIENKGIANVRVYLKPGTYTERLKFNVVKCAEVIGIPGPGGEMPLILGENIVSPEVGIIVRGVAMDGGRVTWSANIGRGVFMKFLIHQGVRIANPGHNILGTAKTEADPTYIEYTGSVIGPNPGWHLIYLERSCGTIVVRGSVFYGSGWSAHSFKNLCDKSILEGNVFSNVGLDGKPLGVDKRGKDQIGLFSLDLYGCNDVVLRNNTVIFRTSNFVRAYIGSRSRQAWGGCNKGLRQEDGSHALFRPDSPEYQAPATWEAVEAALQRAGDNYDAWRAEPWLTTYLAEGNTLIGVLSDPDHTVATINFNSQRPIMTNPQITEAKPRFAALTQACAEWPTYAKRESCWVAGADPDLLYVYEHIDLSQRVDLVNKAIPPSRAPVPVPANWRERAAHFVSGNRQILCDVRAENCAESDAAPVFLIPDLSADAVAAANPPRVFDNNQTAE